MKAKTLTAAQLVELQNSLRRINDILGFSVKLMDVPSARPVISRPRKQTPRRMTTATFTYRWYNAQPERLTRLYRYLLHLNWIASDTSPDDFSSLFSGEHSYVRIQWTGSNLQLAYLIRVLIYRNYIVVPPGVGKWICVYSHFVGRENKQLHSLNSLHVPIRSQSLIEQMAELLNPRFA